MKIHILHPSATDAAHALCDVDLSPYRKGALRILECAGTRSKLWKDPLIQWCQADLLNYFWLGKFAEVLEEILALPQKEAYAYRQNPPDFLHRKYLDVTPFPFYDYQQYSGQPVIAAHRINYVNTRREIAEWDGREKPGWFTRLESSLSIKGRSADGILCGRTLRPLRSVDAGGTAP